MKNALTKASSIIRTIFGYGIMITLFAGGLTFLGYVAAIIIGGDTAAEICEFIYKILLPKIIYASTIFVFLGLVSMYLVGESSLTASKKKEKDTKSHNLSKKDSENTNLASPDQETKNSINESMLDEGER